MKNLYEIPEEVSANATDEFLEALVCGESGVNVERIVSLGQVTAEGQWYDQDRDEWVVILQGVAKVQYQDGLEVTLNEGEHLFLPSHVKHRVSYTSSPCIWLAVFGQALKLKCGVKK